MSAFTWRSEFVQWYHLSKYCIKNCQYWKTILKIVGIFTFVSSWQTVSGWCVEPQSIFLLATGNTCHTWEGWLPKSLALFMYCIGSHHCQQHLQIQSTAAGRSYCNVTVLSCQTFVLLIACPLAMRDFFYTCMSDSPNVLLLRVTHFWTFSKSINVSKYMLSREPTNGSIKAGKSVCHIDDW